MTGFIVSAAAVLLTAWIVWAATYNAAYLAGYQKAREDLIPQPCHVPAGTESHLPSDTIAGTQFVHPRADCHPPGCNDFPECDHRY